MDPMMKFHNGYIELGFTPDFLPQHEYETTPYLAPVYDYSECDQSMNIAFDEKVTVTNKD
jgi:hypothetical protein